MSTDGSREIYKEFEKVIVIDNPRKEMHQARTRLMLFEVMLPKTVGGILKKESKID